jgi:GT2 family glycosyltransferase
VAKRSPDTRAGDTGAGDTAAGSGVSELAERPAAPADQVAAPKPGPAATAVSVAGNRARLAIVMINWNRPEDTIECLESLLRTDIPMRVIVVDNGSEDDSIDRLQRWAAGETPYEPPLGPMRRFTAPAVQKPVPVRIVSDAEAVESAPGDEVLTIIASPENRGFSGGNNVGLRHAMKDPGISYMWCLNNDTVVDPGAPAAVLARMDATHKVGMCGTQVRYYHRPGTWQQLNGSRFKLLTGMSKGIGANQPITRPFDPKKVAQDTDFVLGASLIVSRAFLDTIGYMEESYFLYFEEMDWSVRNRGRFAIAFAHGAVIYHKEGGSIGSSGKAGQRSESSEYYLMRSRIKFYRRNFPLLWPLQYPLGVALICRRILRRQPAKAAVMTRALLGMSRS